MFLMPLCETCSYGPWSPSNPVTEKDFIEALGTLGVVPSGEGPVRVGIGSPFRIPLPKSIELCCLDSQMCRRQGVPFVSLEDLDEVNVKVNRARSDVYDEAGLPSSIGSS